MKKWVIIAIVALAVILLVMNLKTLKQKKEAARTQSDAASGSGATKPPVTNGGSYTGGTKPPVMETIDTNTLVEQNDIFGVPVSGTGNEDMASGMVDVQIIPISRPVGGHTGVSMPAGFYGN